jgi:transposase
LTWLDVCDIIKLSQLLVPKEDIVVLPTEPAAKRAALRAYHALNPQPHAVTDPAFTTGPAFFDAEDLVQVKYEMLRRVQVEGLSVSAAAARFGFSRPSFYAAQRAWQQEGLPGLLPQRPGPRRAHKLTPEVLAFLEHARAQDPSLRLGQLTHLIQQRFGLSVHPRGIERSLAQHQQKKRPEPHP